MSRSASYVLGPGAPPAEAIGKIQTAIGSITVTRISGAVARGNVGDLLYLGDVIETAADGAVAMTFKDGTAFNLSASGRMALDEFIFGSNAISNSVRFGVVKGLFTFIAGKVAKAGSLSIDTPVATIRRASGGGTGLLTLAALTLAVIDELNADSNFSILDGLSIDFKDLPHGVLEIRTKGDNPQLIVWDDPGRTLVISPAGSTMSVDQVTNTPTRMAELQVQSVSAAATFTMGQQDPDIRQMLQQGPQQRADASQSAAGGSSGTNTAFTSSDPSHGSTREIVVVATTASPPNNPPQSNTDTSNNSNPITTAAAPPILIAAHAPTVATPGAGTLTAAEDHAITIRGFSVEDADGDRLTVTLTATSTLTLASTDGLDFSVGDGTADRAMTFSGSAAAVTAALDGLTYTPTPDFSGTGHISYQVSDGTNTTDGVVDIDVTAVNDAPVLTVPGPSANTSQNTPIDLTGATLTDPDMGDVITVTLQVSHGTLAPLGNGEGLTSIDGIGTSTLTIVGSASAVNAAVNAGVTYTPDADFTGADQLSISASDDHNGSDDETVTIDVKADVNEAPTAVTFANTTTTINENTDTSVGLKVADIVVADDALGAETLALTGADAAFFEIVGTELRLKAGVLNYEAKSSYSVQVTANDPTVGGSPDATSAVFTVNVGDVNEAPTAVTFANTTTTINENTDTSVGLKVADIVVADDALGAETLALTGADAAFFEIVGTELRLKAGVLNYEAKSSYSVQVTADDPTVGGSPDATSAVFTVNVGDVNEAPTAVTFANTTTTINENTDTSVGLKVADIVVADDALGAETLALTGADAAFFEIVGTELRLKAGVLNYEAKSSYSVQVTANDPTVGGSPDATSAVFTVNVGDVNEAPTAVTFANTTTTINENTDTSVGLKVADIVVADDALGAETLALTGADAAFFEIVGTELRLKAGVLNYEAKSSYSVQVTANDPTVGGSPDATSAVFTVNVGDVNEAPTAVTFANTTTTINENTDTSVGLKVADIVVADDALGAETLALTGADAAFFEIVGTELRLKAGVLNYEAKSSYSVQVTANDPTVGGSPDATSAVFTVNVGDVNEAPTAVTFANTTTTINENTDTSVGLKVADIVVADDALGAETLALTGADAAFFEIVGTELRLKAGVLNYEAKSSYSVQVTADDPTVGGSPDATSAVFTVNVGDVNEAPTAVTFANTTTTINENTDTSVGLKVADIVVADDALGAETLALTGADAAFFEIVGTELRLKAGVLNYEAKSSYSVQVTANDPTVGGSPDATSAVFTVNVGDVNEAPTAVTFANTTTTINENTDTSVGLKVADIVVADDALGAETLALTGADAAFFEIVGTELRLKAGVLNYEAKSSYSVQVTANDPTVGGSPDATSAVFTVNVGDVNEAPTAVTFANTTTTINENTDTSVGLKVADIVVADDALGAETLALTGADAAFFEIVGTELRLKAGVLNYEAKSSYSVQVTADDPTVGGSPDATSAVFTVNVGDVNEAPTVSGPSSGTVTEDAPSAARTVTGQLTGTDPDAGDSVQIWTVQGGTTPQPAQYSFRIDEFKVTRPGSTIFDDTFGDGAPPASGPGSSYVTSGSFTEFATDGGYVVLDGTNAVSFSGTGTATPLIGQSALLLTDTSSNPALGLKVQNDFSVEGKFDLLLLPDDLREGFGIALTDRTGSGPGQLGDDTLQLTLVRGTSGNVVVQLRHIDPSGNTNALIESIVLDATPLEDQIVLRLSHTAGTSTITAAFDLYANGVYQRTINFTATDNIFHGEDWTRAQFFAVAPDPTVSYRAGTYGTLSIDENGLWTYTLNNGSLAVQALAENQTEQEFFTIDAYDGHGGIGHKTITIDVHGTNDNPSLTGDLTASVVQGGAVKINDTALSLTPDIVAEDPDNPASERIYTVDATDHGHLVVSSDPNNLSIDPADWNQPFSQAELDAGHVFFVHDGADAAQSALFTVTLSDGVAGSTPVTATVTMLVSSVRINVLTDSGYDFDADSPIEKMGLGAIQPGGTSTQFTILYDAPGADPAADRIFVFNGNFTYPGGVPTGFITKITERDGAGTLLAEFLFGANVAAAETWLPAAVAAAQGDDSLISALSATWNFSIFGMNGEDRFGSGDHQDSFRGLGGNDVFDGGGDFDRANYTSATGPIMVNLAAGTVEGTGANSSSVGTDTLQSIEFIGGTEFDDIYIATGFNSQSANAGSSGGFNVAGTFNRFEGRGGDDTIVGNDDTQVSYLHAFGGVTVNLDIGVADGSNPLFPAGTIIGQAFGTAPGDVARVGTDTFSHVNRVLGSYYDDILIGSSNNPSSITELFEGRGGNDFINGNGGIDIASYGFDPADEFGNGITIDLAAGIVTGGFYTGTDTLCRIEGISGTEFNDSYDAHNFGAAGFADPNLFNVGNNGTFNFFEGRGGDDTVIGNGNTRVQYSNAKAGVTVTLAFGGAGSAVSTAPNDVAGIGIDTFISGVNAVRGSEFGDSINGNGVANTLEGGGGDDALLGGAGNDMLIGGSGDDTLSGGAGNDTASYSSASAGVTVNLSLVGAQNTGGDGNDTLSSIENITGSAFNDILTGDGNANVLAGGAGDDTLSGGAGNDTASYFSASAGVTVNLSLVGAQNTGGDGNDTLSSIENITGSAFNDILTGDGNANVLAGGAGDDTLSGGAGNDTASYSNASAGVTVNLSLIGAQNTGGAGNDTLSSIENITGSAFNDILTGDGNANILAGGAGDDTLSGGAGNDTASYSNASAGVTVNLSLIGAQNTGGAGNDTLSSIENITGSAFNDILTGDGNANILAGGAGNDTASYSSASAGVTVNLSLVGAQNTGGAGNDTLSSIENITGSAFNDILTGDANANVLAGGAGDDTLSGGAGNDTASYSSASAGVTVNLSLVGAQNTGGAGNDTLSSMENITGSAFNDILTGDANANVLAGGAGNDTLSGGAGNDTASYEDALAGVTVSLAIVGSQNTIGAGNDTLSNFENLRGSASDDTLIGNSSANVLDGFGGEDVLTGLNGADTFVFRGGVSTITDFDQGNLGTFDHSEGDRIDVSNLNGGNGFNSFAELQPLLIEQDGNTIINFGDGNLVTVLGVPVAQLQETDFILL